MTTACERPPRAHAEAPLVRHLALAASVAVLTGAGLVSVPATAAAHTGGAPDFGPNVFVYDPSTPVAQIQTKLDELFTQQEHNEMGTNRYAVLFKPGRYDVNARLGYYTTVAGLGRSPDDVDINGAVRVVGQPDPGSVAGHLRAHQLLALRREPVGDADRLVEPVGGVAGVADATGPHPRHPLAGAGRTADSRAAGTSPTRRSTGSRSTARSSSG